MPVFGLWKETGHQEETQVSNSTEKGGVLKNNLFVASLEKISFDRMYVCIECTHSNVAGKFQ